MNSQFKIWFILLIVAFSWSACTDDTEYEILTSEDILPQAKGKYDYSEDSLTDEEAPITPFEENLIELFPELNFDQENILKERKKLFMPDRLGYKSKEETYFYKDSVPFHVIEWTFDDSVKTVNAFYNWLDCFGHDCRSIRIDETKNGSQEAFAIWITNNKITYIASSKSISLKTWQEVFFGKEKDLWYYVIQQAPRGKINWIYSTIQRKKEEEIQKK